MLRPHVVILGAGFGGVYVAKRLRRLVKKGRIDLTIVNRTNYFLFTPLLHEVATGGLSPRTVAEPLREIFAGTGVRVIQANVQTIDLRGKAVTLQSPARDCVFTYDALVIATGAETNYYGIPGAVEYSLPLKNLYDAARIRNRIIDAFEQAALTKDQNEKRRFLSFAVVGGGATGVEVAGELAEFVRGLAVRYYDCEDCLVTLIHAGAELLEMFPQSLRRGATERLKRKGVSLRLGNAVTSVTKEGLTLGNNVTLTAGTVIWAAGVKPGMPRFAHSDPPLSGGRLAVDQYFRIQGQEQVYVLGDAANGAPMLAQAAVLESRIVAENIIAELSGKKLRDFRYHSKGNIVSIGQWFAVGEIYSMNISGKLAWWLWRTVYLFKFASKAKRIRIVFEWTLDLFFPRDITKLI